MKNLTTLNLNQSAAVDMRQEIDLKIGASFTRFQTLNFGKYANTKHPLLSYGPCQFPTLGFVVERWKESNSFISENFYSLKFSKRVKTGVGNKTKAIKFEWVKERIYDREEVNKTYTQILELKTGVVEKVEKEVKYNKRPQPINTISLQKTMSQLFMIDSKKTMEVAESLYNMGLISYPRTETTKFDKNSGLRNLVNVQLNNPLVKDFVEKLSNGELWGGPNNGILDDKAHPPIHPVSLPRESIVLTQTQEKMYNYIVRHFLACLSKDAVYEEARYLVKVGNETFAANGKNLTTPNYLEVYTDRGFVSTPIPDMEEGTKFKISGLKLEESVTKAPPMLSESALITKMDQNGIGTDATIHEHINKIKYRGYAIKEFNQFKPTPIGLHLIESYTKLGLKLEKPDLRAEMERDMKAIERGEASRDESKSDDYTNTNTYSGR